MMYIVVRTTIISDDSYRFLFFWVDFKRLGQLCKMSSPLTWLKDSIFKCELRFASIETAAHVRRKVVD